MSTTSPRNDAKAWRAAAPRRGLSREEAAIYVGISASKFDELVKVGRMPKAKKIGSRRLFDMRALDLAFDDLPSEDSAHSEDNPWDGCAL